MKPLCQALLFVIAFSMATVLVPWQHRILDHRQPGKSDDVLTVLMGDGRKIFANHFFEKADVYFHSGFYPSIFDQASTNKTPHMAAGADGADEHHEEEIDFMGPPRDWIDAFSRHFYPSRHTHLDEGGAEDHDHDHDGRQDHAPKDHKGPNPTGHHEGETAEEHAKHAGLEREMLPWLRISAELDPNRVETYTVSSFWLRKMGKEKEAIQFLREGLHANPDSYEILLELGRVYDENLHDVERARNVWEMSFTKWKKREASKKPEEQDRYMLAQILARLGQLEEKQGNLQKTLEWWLLLKDASGHPEDIQKQIDKLKEKMAAPQRPK
jgi:tetratricopeptide (TPR) repeat protein